MSEREALVGRSSGVKRMFYVDNIRIYLTILVIIFHVAIAYGGHGDWPLKETPTDPISPFLFTLFVAVTQSYFMSFFFLLSGYFTPRSYDKKGSILFSVRVSVCSLRLEKYVGATQGLLGLGDGRRDVQL